MEKVGVIGTAGIVGSGVGGVAGFVTGGPAGVLPGATAGFTVGTKLGCVVKAEKGVDSAGRKVEQIAIETSTKIGNSIEKSSSELSAKVGQNVDALGVAVAKATVTATDKLCDSASKAIEALVNNWSGIVVSGYVLSAFLYATRETSDIYFKHCKGQEKDVNCVVMSLANLSVNLAIIGTTGFIFHQMFKHRK